MHILVVEDDPNLREAIIDTLMLKGHEVRDASNGVDAMAIIRQTHLDLVLSDINMPQMDGLELLDNIKQHSPWLPVILMTAYGDVGQAVKAMQLGASDYLMKPFEVQELMVLLKKYNQAGIAEEDCDGPVSVDSASQQLFSVAKRVAQTDSTVLISGESGTGKEVLARFIHQNSKRSKEAFIAINCAAIPENMLEAMLFGYEKGAFTGAYSAMPGKFEQANGGTLLLDEITEMDIGLQAKLLRVLQEQQVERLGGKKVINLDVRILATTNRELIDYVAEGNFREDLYYRLSVFPLNWMPLRERPGDIIPLAQRLIAQHSEKMKRPIPSISNDAADMILQHSWPGNVRELDNTMQRALILQQGSTIQTSDLILTPVPKNRQMEVAPQARVQTEGLRVFSDDDNSTRTNNFSAMQAEEADSTILDDKALGNDLKHREVELIVQALKEEPSKKEAAERLGISPRTLRYKMAKLREQGLDVESKLVG